MAKWIAGLALLVSCVAPAAQARISVDDIYLECAIAEQPASADQAAPYDTTPKIWLRIGDDLFETWDAEKATWFRNECAVSPQVHLTYRRCGVTEDKIFVIVAYDLVEGAARNSYDGETIIDRRTGHYTQVSVMKVNGKTVLSNSHVGLCEKSDAHRGNGPVNKF